MRSIDRRLLLSMLVAAALPARGLGEPLPLAVLPGGVEAPDFALPDLAGALRRLSDYRGRPVLVSFWALWCPPCRRELPALSDLRTRIADTRIEVMAINLGDRADRIAAFLVDHPSPGLPVLLDGKKSAAVPWHVQELPVAYAVGSDGILRLGAMGERDWRAPEIEAQLRALT